MYWTMKSFTYKPCVKIINFIVSRLQKIVKLFTMETLSINQTILVNILKLMVFFLKRHKRAIDYWYSMISISGKIKTIKANRLITNRKTNLICIYIFYFSQFYGFFCILTLSVGYKKYSYGSRFEISNLESK